MNRIEPAIHRSSVTQVEYTDRRLVIQPVFSWTHRLIAIAVGIVAAAYVATLPFTGLTRLDPSYLPFTQFGLGVFANYAICFLLSGLLPSLLMAKTQLEKPDLSIISAAIWGVLIGAFVYALAIAYFAAQAGWKLSPDWTWLIGFLALPAVFIGALGGVSGWGTLTLIRKHLGGWA